MITLNDKNYTLVPVYQHVAGAVHIGYPRTPSDENPSWELKGYILQETDYAND